MNQILTLLDRPIAFHRVFAEIGGSVTAGVFLSQAVYWSQRTDDPDGWFWKTQSQWFEETYLKRREQENARRELRVAGILEEKKKGTPAKLYFRIKLETLTERLLSQGCQNATSLNSAIADTQNAETIGTSQLSPGCQDVASLDARMQHVENLDAEIVQTCTPQNVQTSLYKSDILLNTETTAETTPEKRNKTSLSLISLSSSMAGKQEEERERERGFASQEEEEEEEVEEETGKTPVISQTNPCPRKPAYLGLDQSSAAPPLHVENAIANYGGSLPAYRANWKPGGYNPGFVDYTWSKMRQKYGDRSIADAVAALENAERDGLFGRLDAAVKDWQTQELEKEAREHLRQEHLATSQAIPAIEDLSDQISAYNANLKILGWTNDDAYRHMVQEHGWEEKTNAVQGRISRQFNMLVLKDRDIEQIHNAIAQLVQAKLDPTHPKRGINPSIPP